MNSIRFISSVFVRIYVLVFFSYNEKVIIFLIHYCIQISHSLSLNETHHCHQSTPLPNLIHFAPPNVCNSRKWSLMQYSSCVLISLICVCRLFSRAGSAISKSFATTIRSTSFVNSRTSSTCPHISARHFIFIYHIAIGRPLGALSRVVPFELFRWCAIPVEVVFESAQTYGLIIDGWDRYGSVQNTVCLNWPNIWIDRAVPPAVIRMRQQVTSAAGPVQLRLDAAARHRAKRRERQRERRHEERNAEIGDFEPVQAAAEVKQMPPRPGPRTKQFSDSSQKPVKRRAAAASVRRPTRGGLQTKRTKFEGDPLKTFRSTKQRN